MGNRGACRNDFSQEFVVKNCVCNLAREIIRQTCLFFSCFCGRRYQTKSVLCSFFFFSGSLDSGAFFLHVDGKTEQEQSLESWQTGVIRKMLGFSMGYLYTSVIRLNLRISIAFPGEEVHLKKEKTQENRQRSGLF